MKLSRKQVLLRDISLEDCEAIPKAFKAQGWDKPKSLYKNYYEFQLNKKRDIIIAEYKAEFAGYVTIKWDSDYLPFNKSKIPEIVDFNVLKKFQRLGIGTLLMDEAERRIKLRSDKAGIGVGLYVDYGAAQILYLKRNYIFDGQGLFSNDQQCAYGDTVTVDDGLTLHLIKNLNEE